VFILKNHVTRTRKWKDSKKLSQQQYSVICQPAASSNWVNVRWGLNHVPDFPIMTISTLNLNASMEIPFSEKISQVTVSTTLVPYCLDAGNITEDAIVSISACYPSEDPQKNRDKSQQWIWSRDTTVRPYSNQTLCLTNFLSSGKQSVELKLCGNHAEQHWAYDGDAPGNKGQKEIYYGAYSLGVVTSSENF